MQLQGNDYLHRTEDDTHEAFSDLQKEVIATRDYCLIDLVQQEGDFDFKITGIIEGSRRQRVHIRSRYMIHGVA